MSPVALRAGRRRLLRAAALPGVGALLGTGAVGAAHAQAPAPAPSPTPSTAPSPVRRPIFVLNSLDATVSVVDPQTFTETRRLPTGKEPHHLYLTPDEKSVIVANAAGNSLTFIDPVTATVQRTLHGIVDPYHLRFSPDMKWFVTAANRLDHVDIYQWLPQHLAGPESPLKLVKRIAAPKTPSHLAIDSRSRVVYVSLQDSDELLAIDLATQTPTWKVKTGRMPADIYLTPDDKTLLVALTGDSVVEAWDVSAGTASPPRLGPRVATGKGAHAFRARGDKRHVFVSNRVANTISLLDVTRLAVVAEYPAPGGPDCMEMLADGRTLLVTSRWARKLSFIDLEAKKVVRQVDVGRSPHGVWTLDHAPR